MSVAGCPDLVAAASVCVYDNINNIITVNRLIPFLSLIIRRCRNNGELERDLETTTTR